MMAIKYVILFVAMLFATNCFSSTRIFYENYDDTPSEQNTLAGVEAYSEFTHIGRTNAVRDDGDHSILQNGYGGSGYFHRVHHGNGSTGLQDQSVDISETSTGELYVSYRYRLSQYYQIELPDGQQHKYLRFWLIGDSAMRQLVSEHRLSGNNMQHQFQLQGDRDDNDVAPAEDLGLETIYMTNEPDYSGEFSSNTFIWHHMEVYIKYDSPAEAGNGIVRVWIDGVLVSENIDIDINVIGYEQYNRISIPSNYSYGYGPGTHLADVDIDEVEIWDGMPDEEPTPIPGECGTADGVSTATEPTENLCAEGTAGDVSLSGSNWIWECSGIDGGTDDSCSAPYDAPSTGSIYPYKSAAGVIWAAPSP